MSAKGKFIILKKYRAGDYDLIAKAYGQCGMVRVFVPNGMLPEVGYTGYLEPFNLVVLVFRQYGEILLVRDVVTVVPFSYQSHKSYTRYVWMSSILRFVDRWFLQYDAELFELIVGYLSLKTKNPDVFLLKFKLEFLKKIGLYRDEIFHERLRKTAVFLLEEEFIRLERLKINPHILADLDRAIESHLSASL